MREARREMQGLTSLGLLRTEATSLGAWGGSLQCLTSLFNGVRRSVLAGNALWTLIGNLVYAGCQWGMLSAIAKTMPLETAGRFAIALAISAPVIILSQLQLRAAQATDSTGVHQVREYVTLRCLMAACALVAIGIICAIANYDIATVEVVCLVSLAKTVESISDVLFGVFQQREQMVYVGKSLVLKGLLSLAVFVPLIVFTHDLNVACAGLLVAWSAVLIGYDIRRAKELAGYLLRHSAEEQTKAPRPVSFAGCGRLLKATLPLGAASCLYTLTPNLPRYVLDNVAGRSQLGIYAVLTYVVVAGTTVVNALGTAATPRLAQAFAAKRKENFVLIALAMFGAAAAIGLAIFAPVAAMGPALLTLLYGSGYSRYQSLFLWVIGSGAVGYCASILGYAVVATRHFRAQVPIHASVALTTLIACQVLIPRFGTVGATWGVLCGSIVSIAASCAFLRRILIGFDARETRGTMSDAFLIFKKQLFEGGNE